MKDKPTPPWDPVLNGPDHKPFRPWSLTTAEMWWSERDVIAKRYGEAEAERIKPLAKKPSERPDVPPAR